jgi:hypothetical protein
MDDMEEWKSLTLQDSKSDPSVVQPVASRYTDYAIPARDKFIYKNKIIQLFIYIQIDMN